MVSSKKLTLWGYYGSNYGDDIMLECISDWCRRQNRKVRVISTCNYGRSDNLATYWMQLSLLKKLYYYFYICRNSFNVWGGGTIFTETEGDGNYNCFKQVKRFGGSFGYVGVGIGNLSSEDRINRTMWCLRNSLLTVVRDELSYGDAIGFNAYNVSKAADLVYIYADRCAREFRIKPKDYALVTLRPVSKIIGEKRETLLNESVCRLIINMRNASKFKTVVLQKLDSQCDGEVVRKLSNQLTSHGITNVVREYMGVEDASLVIAESSFHLSGRLHGSMVSEAMGIPTCTISYCRKIQAFYSEIQRDNFINILSADMDANIANFIPQESKPVDMFERRTKAAKNFEYLNKALNLF